MYSRLAKRFIRFLFHVFSGKPKKDQVFSRQSYLNPLAGRKSWIKFHILAIAVAYLVVVLGNSFPALSQAAPVPFNCDGILYISQAANAEDPTQLNFLNTQNLNLEDEGGTEEGTIYNAAGFRFADGFIYGILPFDDLENDPNVPPPFTIFRIGQDGVAEELGTIENDAQFPDPQPQAGNDDSRYFAGDFDEEGFYYVYSRNQGGIGKLLKIDVTQSPPDVVDVVDITTGNRSFFDIAFNPVDGNFYSYESSAGQLARIDPNTGNVTFFDAVPTDLRAVGAIFFDALGNLFAYENATGTIYRAGEVNRLEDPQTDQVTFIQVASGLGSVAQNDGASCPFAPIDLAIEKTVDPNNPTPGNPVTYTITATNQGNPDSPIPLLSAFTRINVRDVLPAEIEVTSVTESEGNYDLDSGDWTDIDLGVGEDITLTITGTLAADATGRITNVVVAEVRPPEINTDPDFPRDDFPPDRVQEIIDDILENPDTDIPTNNISTVDFVANPDPAIGVAKEVTDVTALGGNRFQVTYDLVVENVGNVPLDDITLLEDLEDTFGVGNVVSTTVSSNDDLTLNPNFTGIGNAGDPMLNLLGNGNSLDMGESARVQLEAVVTPPDLTQNYNNQVEATGISPGGTTVNDLSDNEIPTDPNVPLTDKDGDGDADEPEENTPTPVNFSATERPAIGVAKSVGTITPLAENRFRITYNLLVENLGNVTLDPVTLTENLNDTFGRGNFTVNNVTSPTLTTNPNYDGNNILNLLGAGNSLNTGETATVQLVIEVTPPDLNQTYNNQVEATGTSPNGTQVTDLSDDNVPTDDPNDLQPDPDGDNNANEPEENTPTPVNFNTIPENPAIGVAKSVGSIQSLGGNRFRIIYDLGVDNLGNVPLSNVTLEEDLEDTFGVDSDIEASVTSDDLTTNPNFTGIGNPGDSTVNLLAAGNTLDISESATLQLNVIVTPPDPNRNYENQVEATGTSPRGTEVDDLSDNGFPSDPDGDGNANEPEENDPTPVNFGELPAIGVAKNATSIAPIGNNRFQVTYDLVVENLGNVSLEDVRLLENLTETFGAGNFTVVNVTSPSPTFSITDPTLTLKTLTVNPNYNGSTIINLLADGNTLNVDENIREGATLQLVVDVTPPNLNADYENQVQAVGFSPSGTSVDDFSDNGVPADPDSLEPDPDGDNNANEPEENDPTIIRFTTTPANPLIPGNPPGTAIGVAKSVDTVQDNNDGTFTIPYTIEVRNLGNTTLTNVQVTENLFGNNRSTFSGTERIEISNLSVTGALSQVNQSFDGENDQNLLSGSESLGVGANGTATITLDVTITPGRNFGPFENSAVARGTRNGTIVSDASTPGTNPDPNGDGNPGNDNQPTPVSFGEPGEPNLRLVKRITDVLRNGESLSNVNLNRVIDDQNDPDDNVAGWSALPNGLLGVINLGSEVSLQSGDEVEYTIYYLSDGESVVENVQICDAIPEQTTFVPGSIKLIEEIEKSLSDNEDEDEGTFVGGLTPIDSLDDPRFDDPPCPNPNPEKGSVLVNVGDVPSTAPNNVGFVRFRVTID